MAVSDTITVMLLDHVLYATFTYKSIIDARAQTGVLLCLTFDSPEVIDDVQRRARAAGGRTSRAIEDQGFMYGGTFDDPTATWVGDGVGWTLPQSRTAL